MVVLKTFFNSCFGNLTRRPAVSFADVDLLGRQLELVLVAAVVEYLRKQLGTGSVSEAIGVCATNSLTDIDECLV